MLLLLAALAAAAPLPPGVRVAPPPAWVAPLAAPLQVDDNRSWLLVDDQALLDGPRTVHWSQQVSRMRTRADLQEQARVTVAFDPAEQQVQLHALEVFRDGRWSDRLETARAELIRREDALWQDLLDGTQTLVLLPEDVALGDVLRASYSVIGDDTGFGDYGAWSATLAWSVPVVQRQVRVGTPEGAPEARWTVHGANIGAPPPEHSADGTRWQTLLLRNLPPWSSPADLPLDLAAYPWLEATTWPDWATVVDHFSPRYRPEELAGLEAVRTELDPGTDPAARVVAALRWTQESVRYLGLEMGAGSHSPRPLGAVLRSRYGDCKDKARLLVAILDGWGIAAWPALVDSRGGDPRKAAPSPLAFDHVIVAVDWPAAPGGLLWVDPTLTDQGGPGAASLHLGLAAPSYRAALVLRSGETAPRALPAPRELLRTSETRWRLAGADLVEAQSSTTLSASDADQMRGWLRAATPQSMGDWQLPRWSAMGHPLTGPLGGLNWREQRGHNTIELLETVALDGFWWPEGSDSTATLQAVDLSGWLPVPSPDREAALALPGPRRWVETAVLEGVSADALDWPEREHTVPGVVLHTWSEALPPAQHTPRVALHWELQVDRDRLEGPALAAYAAGIPALLDQLLVGLRRHEGRIRAQPSTPPAPPAARRVPPWTTGLAGLGAGLLLGLGLGLALRRPRAGAP